MGIIGWIIIGGLAGWVASKIMNTDGQQGIILNIVVGIVGGLLGGWLLGVLGMDMAGAGIIASFLTALLGAVILLFVVKGRHQSEPDDRTRFRGGHSPRVTFPAVACPSGLRSTPRKRVWVQAHRGFKSHRHPPTQNPGSLRPGVFALAGGEGCRDPHARARKRPPD
jgi:uncharacterized membrane protein YeaQ/YmgE (transglycosylase-associated protein family)